MNMGLNYHPLLFKINAAGWDLEASKGSAPPFLFLLVLSLVCFRPCLFLLTVVLYNLRIYIEYKYLINRCGVQGGRGLYWHWQRHLLQRRTRFFIYYWLLLCMRLLFNYYIVYFHILGLQ